MPWKKPFEYKLSDLISEYNDELYKEVSSKIPIELKKETGAWSAHINNGKQLSDIVNPPILMQHLLMNFYI
jgi:hypothetical protein